MPIVHIFSCMQLRGLGGNGRIGENAERQQDDNMWERVRDALDDVALLANSGRMELGKWGQNIKEFNIIIEFLINPRFADPDQTTTGAQPYHCVQKELSAYFYLRRRHYNCYAFAWAEVLISNAMLTTSLPGCPQKRNLCPECVRPLGPLALILWGFCMILVLDDAILSSDTLQEAAVSPSCLDSSRADCSISIPPELNAPLIVSLWIGAGILSWPLHRVIRVILHTYNLSHTHHVSTHYNIFINSNLSP